MYLSLQVSKLSILSESTIERKSGVPIRNRFTGPFVGSSLTRDFTRHLAKGAGQERMHTWHETTLDDHGARKDAGNRFVFPILKDL